MLVIGLQILLQFLLCELQAWMQDVYTCITSLSVAVQRGNAASVMETTAGDIGLEFFSVP